MNKLLLSDEIRILQFPGCGYITENNIWFCFVFLFVCLIFPNSLCEAGHLHYVEGVQDLMMQEYVWKLEIAVAGDLCMQGRNPEESLQFTLF